MQEYPEHSAVFAQMAVIRREFDDWITSSCAPHRSLRLPAITCFATGQSMSIRNAFNILLVAFWISFQTAMSFAHGPAIGAAPDGVAGASDVHAMHEHSGTDENAPAHHSDADADNCGVTECSALGVIAALDDAYHHTTRTFDFKPMTVLLPVSPVLQTPPPNTTI